jgi:hypothetical protein
MDSSSEAMKRFIASFNALLEAIDNNALIADVLLEIQANCFQIVLNPDLPDAPAASMGSV